MSQRDSGYARKERDLYETPEWVTRALRPHLPSLGSVWEPACGCGQMVRVFHEWGLVQVDHTDIDMGYDFLRQETRPIEAIITNPPYELATEFIEHALRIMEPNAALEGPCIVAMLLRTDFDHAKSRSHLFRDCPAFAKKVVLTRRIVWFEPEAGSKGKSPSFNHAWFIWDLKHEGAPTLAYGPTEIRRAPWPT